MIRAFAAFWTRPLPAWPLALFRILLGCTAIAAMLCSWLPRLGLDVGSDGLLPPAGVDDWLTRQWRFSLLRPPPGLSPEWTARFDALGNDVAYVYGLFTLWMLALGAMALGWRTRIATIVAWALTVSFLNRFSWLKNGGDDLLACGLFYLMLSPSGNVWSLDARRRRRSGRPIADVVPTWPVRLMQIQLCLVYLFTGLVKLSDGMELAHLRGDWLDGSAVYWVLNDLAVARWPYCALPVPLWICRLLSWGTLLFEIGFSAFVCFRRLRPWLLLVGVAFHVGILVHTEVGWFSPITLCWYALFLPSSGPFGRRPANGS